MPVVWWEEAGVDEGRVRAVRVARVWLFLVESHVETLGPGLRMRSLRL